MTTLVSISRQNGTTADFGKQSLIAYLLTPDLSYILAGAAEDETIILKEGDSLASLTKNNGVLTALTKNGGTLTSFTKNGGTLTSISKN